jgi:hypothetical protein
LEQNVLHNAGKTVLLGTQQWTMAIANFGIAWRMAGFRSGISCTALDKSGALVVHQRWGIGLAG